jgi:hypothetical protein
MAIGIKRYLYAGVPQVGQSWGGVLIITSKSRRIRVSLFGKKKNHPDVSSGFDGNLAMNC